MTFKNDELKKLSQNIINQAVQKQTAGGNFPQSNILTKIKMAGSKLLTKPPKWNF